ncbi:hypothetical protein [Blastococcus goldschmidtiae]|uniref:Uncharacterized protein n=1 Tax=Blastococcus goldschmidtiae TaxID=3075546 RepID=A0ABU2K8J9_9ACTN|nr:hypothetical protein [Blastococcus sp. DSM 46792]MDT0276519.1 hypothetical protein [Blastococcus sp. DSM 46792]
METIHAGRRRSLPPVPRAAIDSALPLETVASAGALALAVAEPGVPMDDAQRFVSRLRSAAPGFAAAAGAESAVVREAVPPARHRRARCRVMLRHADGQVTDVTFVGAVGTPSAGAQSAFGRDIARWLADGQAREGAWLVPDADAHDGVAVDLTAWLSAG